MNETQEKTLLANGEMLIKPKGKSMLPFINEKSDSVVVKLDKKPKKYDVVLYKSGEYCVLHRILHECGAFYMISGDNNAVVEKVPKESIIGVVTEIVRKGRHILCDNRTLRLAVFAWYRLGIKRGVLLCKRIINRIKRKQIAV